MSSAAFHAEDAQEAESPRVRRLRAIGHEARAKALAERGRELLHKHLGGVAAHVRPWSRSGRRSADYFTKQLRGCGGPITLLDICSLLTHPAREAREAGRLLLLELGDALREHESLETLAAAVAAFGREAADVPSITLDAIADGRLEPVELDTIEEKVRRSDLRSERVRAALAAARSHAVVS